MMTINMAKYNYYTMHKANQNPEYQLDFVKTVKWKLKMIKENKQSNEILIYCEKIKFCD